MRRFFLPVALLLALLLSGCSAPKLTLDPQELYALPRLPEQFTALYEQIRTILDSGAEYAAPASGSHIQPVQMTDLNGDGREEALAFFRRSGDDKPLKICVFSGDGATYRQSALIEGSGVSIYSIAYTDLDGDGTAELIVGWRVSVELQALSVYALTSGGAQELIRSDYVKYSAADLDGDGRQEVTVLRAGPGGTGLADCYGWDGEALILRASVPVSMTMAELSRQGRLTVGRLCDERRALFVTGVAEDLQAVTDVLVMDGSGLSNCALSAATGVSELVSPFRGLYPTDIDGDGFTEVPTAIPLPTAGDAPVYYRIEWERCDAAGKRTAALSTFHNTEDGWYLKLPEAWADRICAERSAGTEENSVTFSVFSSDPRPFLRVIVLTGSNREQAAQRPGRFILRRQSNALYVAELLTGNEGWSLAPSEDEILGAFNLALKEWRAGDP